MGFFDKLKQRWAATNTRPTLSDSDAETLLDAALRGETETVAAYLARGVDPHLAGTDHSALLALAVMSDRIETVTVVLDAGADVDRAGHFGCRALHYAKSPAVVHLLVDRGASLDVSEQTKEDPLHELIKRGDDVDTARALLDRGLEIVRYRTTPRGERPKSHLAWAAQCKRPQIVRLLFERGGDPHEVDSDGNPAVFGAFSFGASFAIPPESNEVVRSFLEAGLDPDIRAHTGESALERIVGRRDATSVALALRRLDEVRGPVADVLRARPSLLVTAVSAGDLDVATVLLETDAQLVDGADASGTTALMGAAQHGHDAMIELLLRCGADPQRRNLHGQTALHFAARADDARAFDRLVDAGCRISDEHVEGWTPFDIACANDRVAIVKSLLARGVPIDRRVGTSGATALILASRSGATKVAALLRAHGANASIVDADGKTADDYARAHAEKLERETAERWER